MTYEEKIFSMYWHDLLHAVRDAMRRYPTLKNLWTWVICRLLMQYLGNPYFGQIQGCDSKDKIAIARFGRQMYQMMIEGLEVGAKRLAGGSRMDHLAQWIIQQWVKPTVQEIKESMNNSLSAFVLDTSANKIVKKSYLGQ